MNFRHTYVLLGLLVLAGFAYWLVQAQPWAPPPTPVKRIDPLRIFTLLLPEVDAVRIADNEAGQSATLEREHDLYWLAVPERKQLDTDKMISMIVTLTSLAAERALTDTVALDSFGLKQPVLTLEIVSKGRKETLDVGHATPIGGAYYAQRRETGKIYLLSAKLVSDLRKLIAWLPTAVPGTKPTAMADG